MLKYAQSVIIAFAALLAFILFFIGIRRIKLNGNRSQGFFITTLFIVLSLIGCNGSASPYESKRISSRYCCRGINKRFYGRIIVLNSTQQWRDFKAFWKRLDQIKPRKGEYSRLISYDTAGNLKNELERLTGLLRRLEKSGIISSIELNLLAEICKARIDYMTDNRRTMTRMIMPFLGWTYVSNIEINIDTLIKLRRKNKVSAAEFKQALANVRKDVAVRSIIFTIRKHYPYLYYGGIVENPVEVLKRHYYDFVRRRQAGKVTDAELKCYKDIDYHYAKTIRALVKLKSVFPEFRELIFDLLNHD